MKKVYRQHQGRPAVTLPAGVRDWGRWVEEHLGPPQIGEPGAAVLNAGVAYGSGGATGYLVFPAGSSSLNKAFFTFDVLRTWQKGRVFAVAWCANSTASVANFEVSVELRAMRAGRGLHSAGTVSTIIFPGSVTFNQPLPAVSTLQVGREPVQRGDISVSLSFWRTGTLNDANLGDLRLFKVELWFLPAS